ncbi:MAG: type II toxin-antitoxin system HicB family antitoxin [Syntrophobacteraceae bacterium]
MHTEYTAVVKQDGDWWIGWVEEIPGINCQERSLEELKETLRETLKEALDLNRGEALSAAGVSFQEIKLAI